MLAREAWGLDLGRSAVKAVLLRAAGADAEILDADIIPLEGAPPGDAADLGKDARLWQALSAFQQRHRVRKGRLCVAIPAQNVFVHEFLLPAGAEGDLEQAVRREAEARIPLGLQDVLWGYALFPPGPEDSDRRGVLAAINKGVVESYLRGFRELKLRQVDLVTVSPLALAVLLSSEAGAEGPALALDVGAENTSLVLMENGRFRMRHVFFGGNRMTERLQEALRLDFDAAEQVKLNIARSPRASQIAAALRPTLAELSRRVAADLAHLRGAEEPPEYRAAYVCGGTARLPGLRRQLSSAIGAELQSLGELSRVAISRRADADFVRANLDRLAVAMGAALAGLKDDVTCVSFLPAAETIEARASFGRSLALAVAVATWAIVLSLYGFGLRALRAAEGPLAQYDLLATQVTEMGQELTQTSDRSALEAEVRYLAAAAAGKHQVVDILNGVLHACAAAGGDSGYTFHLSSFSCGESRTAEAAAEGEVPRPWLAGRAIGTVSIPPGGTRLQAHELFMTGLLETLRNTPALAKAKGKASFRKRRTAVTCEAPGWTEVLRRGDLIKTLPDGPWYPVADVVSPGEIRLSRPFAEDDVEAEYVVSRVMPAHYDRPTSQFVVAFEVPGAAPPTTAQMLGSESR